MKQLSINFERIFNQELPLKRIAWFIRQYDISRGCFSPEKQILSKNNQLKSPFIQPNIFGELCIDLFIHLPNVLDVSGVEYANCINRFKASVPNRFAGGAIHQQPLKLKKQWVSIKSGKEVFDDASRLPSSGCWIVPVAESVKGFEHAMELLETNKCYRLAKTGYTLLEDPKPRNGSYEELHAFSESGLGLVKCVNPIYYRRLGGKVFFEEAFWSLYSEPMTILMQRSRWEYENNKKMLNF